MLSCPEDTSLFSSYTDGDPRKPPKMRLGNPSHDPESPDADSHLKSGNSEKFMFTSQRCGEGTIEQSKKGLRLKFWQFNYPVI